MRPLTLRQDALSQVLDLLRLRGVSVMSGAIQRGHAASSTDLLPCVYVAQEGEIEIVARPSGEKVRAIAGDVVLLVHGGGQRLAGRRTGTYLRGSFSLDDRLAGPLLQTLPPIIHLRRPPDRPYEWVQLSCGFILDEVTQARPGATAMVSRLLDLLFVRALRTWAAENSSGPGWLSGAADSRIGKVLAAMHEKPAAKWDLPALAAVAHMSRTAFAARFLSVVGETPMAYLNAWRLDRGAQMLRDESLSISRIVAEVGYGSDAAFNRAFKLRHGLPPARWRTAGRQERHRARGIRQAT